MSSYLPNNKENQGKKNVNEKHVDFWQHRWAGEQATALARATGVVSFINICRRRIKRGFGGDSNFI